MSHRNQPVSKEHTLIIDGKSTKIPAYDKDTIKALNWDKYLNNIYQNDHFPSIEKNKEYF